MSGINHSWADAHEEQSILGMFSMELSHDDIRGGLSKSIWSGHVNLVFRDKVKVGVSRRDEDDLFLHSFVKQWQEQVEQVNGPNDICFATC